MFEIFLNLGIFNTCVVIIVSLILILVTFLRDNCKTLESMRIKSISGKNIKDITVDRDLSIIIPAYNEENRIKSTLEELKKYIISSPIKKAGIKLEIIIVDDGSKDETVKLVNQFIDDPNESKIENSIKFKLIQLGTNQGKGEAVRQGVLNSQGHILLFMDADGATQLEDIELIFKKMLKLIIENYSEKIDDEDISLADLLKNPLTISRASEFGAVIVGSRAHLQEEAVAKRSFYRNFLMHGFHFCVTLVAGKKIKDTQCGFKMFTRFAASNLFLALRTRRFCFDVEIIYLISRYHYSIIENKVIWTEKEGSKVKWFHVLEMAWELLTMKYGYGVSGLWDIVT